MNTTIALHDQSISEDQFTDTSWLRYFDPKKALEGLHAHIRKLRSDKTPEQYTRSTYIRGILYFIEWAGGISMKLPTEQLIEQYIAHLLHEKEWYKGKTLQNGVSAKTVANSYLAPLRIFLKKLKHAHKHTTGIGREFVIDCQANIERALNVKNPAVDQTSDLAPLWRADAIRLNINQVNLVLESIHRSTLSGARDYALFRIMIETGLRVAEVRRITLESIKPNNNHFLITVRGKRSKMDPVSISAEAYEALNAYVERYNAPLTPDDPRYINNTTPVFQVIRRGDTHMKLADVYDPLKHKTPKGKFQPQTGLYRKSIGDIINRLTRSVLGDKFACQPHDCRRTFAYIAYTQGMDIRDISKALRHKNVAITWDYIGIPPEYDNTLLTNYVKIA